MDRGLSAAKAMIPLSRIAIGKEEIEAVVRVLESGGLREGAVCRRFEEEFAAAVGARHAITMANGSLSLRAVFETILSSGDEVLVPGFTFFATAATVVQAGGRPVFCDIDEATFTIDVQDAARRITPRTRAIVPVHLFGNACDIDAVMELARTCDLKVVWDAAQAHLTTWKGADVGSFPDAVSYSFYATKNMTTGEGGMVCTDDEELRDRLTLLKRQGQSGKYLHTVLGTNYRMTDVEAAIGIAQLAKLPEMTARRRAHGAELSRRLAEVPAITPPFVAPGVEHCYHQFTVLVEAARLDLSRDELVAALIDAGIGAAAIYPTPLHRQPVFAALADGPLPRAESVAARCLSLPVHPFLSEADIETIVTGVEHLVHDHLL
jgi:perosamine synthetase